MYFALVQPQLPYGIIGWGGVAGCHLHDLNVIKKWILEIMFLKKHNLLSDLLFKESEVFDISQIFTQTILTNI